MKHKHSGMTLIELLVSLAVLSIMLLAANAIFFSARRLVHGAQANIKARANMRAIQQRFRNDISGLTNTGFLAIIGQADGNSRLVFTGTGALRSMLRSPADTNKPPMANAATMDFGVTQDAHRVLWRRAWLHTVDYPAADLFSWRTAGYAPDGDCLGWALGKWRDTLWPRATIAEGILALPPEPALNLPVKSLTDAIAIWPYLTQDVATFKVQWTSGEKRDGVLVWFDQDEPQNPNWANVYPAQQDVAKNHWPECNLANLGNPPIYCALWTFKNKAIWPRALRILLRLPDSDRDEELILRPPAL